MHNMTNSSTLSALKGIVNFLRTMFSKKQIPLFYPYDRIILLYVFFSFILSYIYKFKIDYKLIFDFKYDLPFLIFVVLSLIVIQIVKITHWKYADKTISITPKFIYSHIRKTHLNFTMLYELFRVLILLKLVLLIYCSIKQAIPFINSRTYDSELLIIDKFLHFGINPNIAMVALFGGHVPLVFFDTLYVFWYALKAPVLAFFVAFPDKNIRNRFFGSYFSLWIIGGLTAVMLPSFGPVYTHPNWFVHLEKSTAFELQRMLLLHYQQLISNPDNYRVYIYEGIAAFPSLHIGVIALFAFFLFKINRILGVFMFIYLAIIQIGSVLLGWHYAVDGYFMIFISFILYRFSDKASCE